MIATLGKILLLSMFVGFVVPSYGKTYVVQPGKSAIKSAINSTSAGDTIVIKEGIYNEWDILVNKKLFIKGEGNVVVDGQKKSEIFVLAANGIVLQGLTVQNTGVSSMKDMAAVRIQEAQYVTVRNNKLLNNTYGVYVQNGAHCLIANNIVRSAAVGEQNSGNGIHAWRGDDLRITGNKVYGHRDGIYLEFVINSTISNNTSEKNVRYGLHFMFSHDDTYTKNVFSDNGSGVAVMFSKGVTMTDNVFKNNWGDAAYGLLLKEITNGKIEGNIFMKNTVGVYMEGATRIHTTRNVFRDNGWAMRIQASSSNGSFTENNFISNSFDVATNGNMVLNVFKNNYWDKYDGYDLDRDDVGDIPYYPVSVYAVVTEKVPTAMILYRSFLTDILDKVEKVMPSIIPDQLKDDSPVMKKWDLQ